MTLPMIRRRPAISPSPGMAVPATVSATALRNVRGGVVVLPVARADAEASSGSCQLHVGCACFGINIPFFVTRNGNPLHNTCQIGSICIWRINVRLTLSFVQIP